MAPQALSSAGVVHAGFWTLSLLFGISSILILLLCMKKKKKNSVVMVRYVKNDEMEVEGHRSRTSTNATTGETERKLSQHSIANENRILPEIPKNGGNGVNHAAPPTPDQSATPGAVSQESAQRNSASSPKRSRRLPALPPPGQVPVDITQAVAIAQNDKDIDDTYEDLRDDAVTPPDPQGEVVGSGDSSLYAKVPEDLKKQDDEESDLYAQVGAAGGSDEKPLTSGNQEMNKTSGGSTSSEEDNTMDSPTAVTYASVDKMKKTMSVKRRHSSSSAASAPPVPDRNFDEEEVVELAENPSQSTVDDDLPPPPPLADLDEMSTGQVPDGATAQAHLDEANETTGPAYDTVSVRESFAHQRLRQMVEDEQRNRYVNTASNSNPRDLYSQIEEENSEAVYESVSVPGSADGTVGVTGRDLQTNNDASTREDGYTTIGAARAARNNPPAPHNEQVVSPNYENIDPA